MLGGFAADLAVPRDLTNTDGNSAARFPDLKRLQEAYSSSYFSFIGTPIDISEIRFRLDKSSGFYTGNPELELRMSTTLSSADRLNASFSSNTGTDEIIVFPRSQLSWNSSPTASFEIVIPLPNHFQYDPQRGNLLLDFSIFNPGGGLGQLDVQVKDGDGLSILGSTALPSVGQFDSAAFVTEFTYTLVPEPPTMSLLSLVGVILCLKRRWNVTP
jgi:hypothetical protein